jgi:hypothetical protein
MNETARTDLLTEHDPISSRRTSVEDIFGSPEESALGETDPLWDSYAAVPAVAETETEADRGTSNLHEWYPPAWLSPEDAEELPRPEAAPPIREEAFENLEPVAVVEAEVDPGPEYPTDPEPEEAPGRYEITGLGTGRLEAIFAEGEELGDVPPSPAISENRPDLALAQVLDVPDQWKFSGNRSRGFSRIGKAGHRHQAVAAEPDPEPEAPAPLMQAQARRNEAPAPRTETPAPRTDSPAPPVEASAPQRTRRREVGKHRKHRNRGHHRRAAATTPEAGEEFELHLPAGRLREGLVGSAIRVLGVALPLAAATMAYLSFVR